MKTMALGLLLLALLVSSVSYAIEVPVAFRDVESMERYFKKNNISATVEVTKRSRWGKKYPRVVRVTAGGRKWVFIDPKKSGYAKNWVETLGKDRVPKGYDIDHVYAKSRAKNRFGFVLLEPVKSEVNQGAGRVFEKRFARMGKTELNQYKQHLDTDVKRGWRMAGPMEKAKLAAVHGVPESKIRVPTGLTSSMPLKEFQERAQLNKLAKAKKLLSGATVASTALLGVTLTNALKGFYASPIVKITQDKLRERQYASARSYFEGQCLNSQTAKSECMKLRKAMSDASTVLRARIWMEFPEFGRKLYESWEAEARARHRVEDALSAELKAGAPELRPADPMPKQQLPRGAYLTFRIINELPRRALGGDRVSMKLELLGQVGDYWVRVAGAMIEVRMDDRVLEGVQTDANGQIVVGAMIPEGVANHRLRLNAGRLLDQTFFVSSYDYIVEADGTLPVGQANGRDAVPLAFRLKKRMIDAGGNHFTTEPGDYTQDFESVAFQGRDTAVKVSSGSAFDSVVKLKPPANTGRVTLSMTSSNPGDQALVADLRGGKFRSRLVEVGRFKVKFIPTVPGLKLKWADSMRRFLKDGRAIILTQTVGAPNKIELSILAVRDKSGTEVSVKGVPIRFSLRPADHVRIGNSLPESGTDGIVRMVGKLPYIWGPKLGRGVIEVTAPGSANTLKIEISGIPENLLLPPGWVHGVLYNSNDGECPNTGKALVFKAWHSSFTTIPGLSTETNVIVGPGERLAIGLPSRHGGVRAFVASSMTDPNSADGGSIAFASFHGSVHGWWFAAGCKDGTRPEKQCDNGARRGGGARCREL